jgi:hypothetical protein
MMLPKEGTQERKVISTGPTFTYSDCFERVLWLSQNSTVRFTTSNTALRSRSMKRRSATSTAAEDYRLKQGQRALSV